MRNRSQTPKDALIGGRFVLRIFFNFLILICKFVKKTIFFFGGGGDF